MATNYRQKYADWCLGEVGNEAPHGDDQYIAYYNSIVGTNFSVNGTAWCAIFATCGARKVGIPTSVIPNFASCTTSRDNFWKPNGRWKTRTTYTPKMGDLIFFDWDLSGNCDHIEVVVDVDSSKVYTVGGNTKGGYSVVGVRHKSYPLTYKYIAGYGAPDYDKIQDNGTSSGSNNNNILDTDNAIVTGVKKFQNWLNDYVDAGLVIDGICDNITRAAAIKAVQTCLNKEYGKNIFVDGRVEQHWQKDLVGIKYGNTGTLVKIAQGLIYGHDIDPDGFDGSFGPGMRNAVISFQNWVKRTANGEVDQGTWLSLMSRWAWYRTEQPT